jgi:F-type H+-transporting ATPase subunit gamma
MESLVRLKNNLSFNKNLDGIINILKITTSIQLRQLQSREWGKQIFLDELIDSFAMLRPERIIKHTLIYRRNQSPQGLVVVTSDEGFLGELNGLLIDTALKERKSEADKLIVVGEKGAQYLEDMGQPYFFFSGIEEGSNFKEVDKLKRYLISEYLKGKFNQVVIIYAEFISVTTQSIKVKKLLPFQVQELGEARTGAKEYEDLLVASSYDKVIEGLVSLSLGFIIYNIFYSSRLSEFSARLMHLEKSSQELIRLNRQLFLEYFKSLHALTDKRIREILSSRILWKL